MHLGVGTARRVGIVLLILAMAWILSLETRAQKVKIKPEAPQPTKGQGLFKTEKYDLLTLAMHEVYEHYNQAQDYFKKQNYDLAGASLRVMEFYLSGTKNILPGQITVWEKDKAAKTITLDKAKYIATVDRLNHYSQQVQAGLAKGQWLQAGGNQPDPMMETCVGCHLSNQVPTDFHRDTDFKILTKLMHEIYYHYRDAGPLLQQERWDQALDLFVVLDPYLEQIPNHIPAVNQDQQPIDKALFLQAHQELTRFTHDMVEKLRTRSWQQGKPLPPPRIVVDNCYACHDKVVKIPSPW